MKFNICGFDQSVLVELNEQHKEIGQQLDCTDLIILQWVADFFSRNSVKKVFIDGNLYAWVVYNNIVEDLPFISVNKRTFADRLDKLKAFGLIEKRVEKQKGYGTYLYIRMTSSYEELVYKKQENDGGCGSNTNGDAVQTPTKDYSTNNKIEKEEGKHSSNSAVPYEEIVNAWNETCTSLNKVEILGDKRKEKIRLRWKEFYELGEPMQILKTIFKKMQASSFITKESRANWRKNCFNWIFENSENWVKVYEGNYDDNQHSLFSSKPQVSGPRYDDYGHLIKEGLE